MATPAIAALVALTRQYFRSPTPPFSIIQSWISLGFVDTVRAGPLTPTPIFTAAASASCTTPQLLFCGSSTIAPRRAARPRAHIFLSPQLCIGQHGPPSERSLLRWKHKGQSQTYLFNPVYFRSSLAVFAAVAYTARSDLWRFNHRLRLLAQISHTWQQLLQLNAEGVFM
jgi:hypothetical protein